MKRKPNDPIYGEGDATYNLPKIATGFSQKNTIPVSPFLVICRGGGFLIYKEDI